MRSLLLTILVLLSCELAKADTKVERLPSPALPLAEKTVPPEEEQAPVVEHTADPYAQWKSWCEPEQLTVCKTKRDCRGIEHPSGRPLKCVRPWYAERGSDYRVCSPGYSNRYERDHQRARLRELVRLQYSGEEELCAESGWQCGQRRRRGRNLASLLNMVAQRETTMRHWKRHRLNGDVAHARKAWSRTAKIYGHQRLEDGAVRFNRGGNKHFPQQWRWEYGLGLYGMNASLFTRTWDPGAPPEVLCREVEATEAYLRSTRKAWRKLSGGINCDKEPGREWHGVAGKPTWYDVHRYASGGQLCPSKRSKAKFEKRARRAGLEPFAPVALADLGVPIDRGDQNDTARLLAAQLDAFSTVWRFERAQP